MESAPFKKIFEEEGFKNIYVWRDDPRKIYPPHKHKGKVSFVVLAGNISMNVGGHNTMVRVGERIDIPIGVEHTGLVGPKGCQYIVGEMIEGDS